jgi:DNA-3-methyladenine glycosylase I
MATTYCAFVRSLPPDHVHVRYHDSEYGFPLQGDAALFERLALEINQAGLSWLTILNKQAAFRAAFDGFQIDRVAAYDDEDRARLLADSGIVRNRLKVAAVIENARRLIALRERYGSFARWLDHHHPLSKEEWRKLFKRTFVFTGGEIVGEFLISTGYLPGAHEPGCPIYECIVALDPPWLRVAQAQNPA